MDQEATPTDHDRRTLTARRNWFLLLVSYFRSSNFTNMQGQGEYLTSSCLHLSSRAKASGSWRHRSPSHCVLKRPARARQITGSGIHQHNSGTHGRQLLARFGPNRKYVTIPDDRDELVTIQAPDWGASRDGVNATWIGHSSFFLIETTPAPNGPRGVRILLDPVFCDRMGLSQPPGQLEDVPHTDAVCISHNHHDHLDTGAIKALYLDKLREAPVQLFCGLGTE